MNDEAKKYLKARKRNAKVILIFFMIALYIALLILYGFDLANFNLNVFSLWEEDFFANLISNAIIQVGLFCFAFWVATSYLFAIILASILSPTKKVTDSTYDFLYDICKIVSAIGTLIFIILWLTRVIDPISAL